MQYVMIIHAQQFMDVLIQMHVIIIQMRGVTMGLVLAYLLVWMKWHVILMNLQLAMMGLVKDY